MATFYQGQNVAAIYFPYNEEEGIQVFRVGLDGVISITVSMEKGQMALVPWFLVEYEDTLRTTIWNATCIEGVNLLIEDKG